MTTGVVTFNPTAFKSRYPEFSTLADDLLSAYFNEATLYLDNTESSRVAQVETRQPLLWMLTAHVAALNGGVNGQAASPLVGRVNSASEGSVTVSVEMAGTSPTAAWFNQTKYGAAFWQATARFRSMRYVVGGSQPADYFGRPN